MRTKAALGEGRGAVEALRKRLSVEQRHGQVVDTVDLVHSVDRAEVRVVEGGGDPGLAIKPFQDFWTIFRTQMRDFEGDLARYECVERFVDRAHSTAPEPAEDTESSELLGQLGGRCPSSGRWLRTKGSLGGGVG
jgi:hypothetical protein